MLMSSDHGAKYYNKHWYHSGYVAFLCTLTSRFDGAISFEKDILLF